MKKDIARKQRDSKNNENNNKKKLSKEEKDRIWNEIMMNPGYSRTVNNNKLNSKSEE